MLMLNRKINNLLITCDSGVIKLPAVVTRLNKKAHNTIISHFIALQLNS